MKSISVGWLAPVGQMFDSAVQLLDFATWLLQRNFPDSWLINNISARGNSTSFFEKSFKIFTAQNFVGNITQQVKPGCPSWVESGGEKCSIAYLIFVVDNISGEKILSCENFLDLSAILFHFGGKIVHLVPRNIAAKMLPLEKNWQTSCMLAGNLGQFSLRNWHK